MPGPGKSNFCFWAMPKQLAFISSLQMQRPQAQTPGQETMHLLQPNETHGHSTFTMKLETSQAFFIIIKKKSNGI